ncbi:MAG: isoprenylcysteine carboxylmethyltransferase family protein [Planctomycetes bacterium]|nr:isoprenylcysteine carboxylmethyltransferase family protein [Planctomycetota bacterium]
MTSTDATPYHRIERAHMRQWVLRVVPPLAVLATNGTGWLDIAALPRFDGPLAAAGLPPYARGGAVAAIRCTGAALVLTAAALRIGAKGVLVRKTTVTTAGVYGLVRHPFYLASMVGAVGVFAVAGPLGAALAMAWLVVALPVFLITVRGEEAGLRRIHGPAWDAYAARVPRLLPTGARANDRSSVEPGPPSRVTWANLVVEGEPPRGLRFLAGALVVAAFGVGGTLGIGLAAAGALCWGASHLVPRPGR